MRLFLGFHAPRTTCPVLKSRVVVPEGKPVVFVLGALAHGKVPRSLSSYAYPTQSPVLTIVLRMHYAQRPVLTLVRLNTYTLLALVLLAQCPALTRDSYQVEVDYTEECISVSEVSRSLFPGTLSARCPVLTRFRALHISFRSVGRWRPGKCVVRSSSSGAFYEAAHVRSHQESR
eukprot:1051712-Rhodomonas_salina.2